jgi:hypothetical protein
MRFNITAKITGSDGSTRQVSGPAEHPSPSKSRMQVDAANAIRKGLKPGETINANDVDVRYSPDQG